MLWGRCTIEGKNSGFYVYSSFCTTKETISKVKRQPSECEKIIANEATDKELISNHPTLAFSHRVQKSVLYICVFFSVSHVGSLLPSS